MSRSVGQTPEGAIDGQRFLIEDVEGSPDASPLQLGQQGILVDRPGACRVNEDGILLEQGKLRRADHVMSLGYGRRMHGDDAVAGEQGV